MRKSSIRWALKALMERKSSIFSVLMLAITGLIAYNLANSFSTTPIGLAAPTPDAWVEIKVSVIVFLFWVLFIEGIWRLSTKHLKSITNFLQRKVMLPVAVRVVLFLVALFSLFDFGFWISADVLGGLNGYGYSFRTYPILTVIENDSGLRYVDTAWRYVYGLKNLGAEGAEAIFFFSIAMIALILFQLNGGIGNALKNTITLIAAPAIIIFELALWNSATQDMSWHVATFLYVGGSNDHGYRIYSTGQYLVSNWFVFAIAILIVASRLPGLSTLSKLIWGKQKNLAANQSAKNSN
jgi:hypothetical protein